MHDYFTNVKHLDNLLWVYSPNASLGQKNGSSNWNRTVDWAYPGAEYVDVVAGTAYNDKLDIDDYPTYVKLNKPLGMAEYGPKTDGKLAAEGSLDTRLFIGRIEKDYPRIAYWVAWHQYDRQHWSIIGNRNAKELMTDGAVITRDDFKWPY
jgi:mannan endo-1,4-beta-mannosidase